MPWRRSAGRVADPEVTRSWEPVNGAGRLTRYDENPLVARRDLAQEALNDDGARPAVGGHLDQRPQVRVVAVQPQDAAAGEAVDRLDHSRLVLGEEGPDRRLVGGDDRGRDQAGKPQRQQVL